MKWGKLVLGSITTVLLVLMITPLAANLSSDSVPRVADTYDAYDPNNSFSTAVSIPTGFTHNLLVDHNPDWFKIYVTNSHRIYVSVNWSAVEDLDLYLYDSNQVMLNLSSGTANPEKVSYDIITPGYYFIQVVEYLPDGVDTTYSLYVDNSVHTQYKLLTLTDAISNVNMSVSIHGTGSKYGSCVYIYLQMVTAFVGYSGVRTYIPLGLILQPSSYSYSDMVIANNQTATQTYAGDYDWFYAYAFSTDLSGSAPSSTTDLTPSGSYSTTSNTYKVLAYCVTNNYYYAHEGQVAIWVTTMGSYSVTSEYYSSYEVSTVNAILNGAGTGLKLQETYSNPWLFFQIFIPIVIAIVVIVVVAVAVSVKRKGGFSRSIAVRPSMTQQPVRAPVTFAPAPQPTIVPQTQPTSIWSQPTLQQATAPTVLSPAAPESKGRFCAYCGTKVDAGERFCHNCGIDMEAKQ